MSDQSQNQGPSIQELRDAAERGGQARKEADELKRENAMLKAGINTDTPLGAMFAKSYDGDLAADKIKAAWGEIAPAPQADPEPTDDPPTPPEQLEETQARRVLTSGGAGDTPNQQPPEDPVKRGFDQFKERLNNGESREKAASSVFGSILQGAIEGDERALVQPWTEEQLGR